MADCCLGDASAYSIIHIIKGIFLTLPACKGCGIVAHAVCSGVSSAFRHYGDNKGKFCRRQFILLVCIDDDDDGC